MDLSRGRAGIRLLFLAVLTALFASFVAACTPPATITVARTADDHAPGSLRAAIDVANTRTSGQEVINLPAGTYDLTVCGTPEDANASGDLDHLTDLGIWIVGEGTGATIRQTCGGGVIDQHGTGKLSLVNVTVTGGRSGDAGAGVRATGSVALDRAKIVDNQATGKDGLDESYPTNYGEDGQDGIGGGLWVGGDLEATSSEISRNTATGGEGGNACQGPYSTNGGAARGAGAYANGKVKLTLSVVADNAARSNTGHYVCHISYGPGTGGVEGAGIYAASVTVDRSQVLRNTATGGPIVSDHPAYVGIVRGAGIAVSGTAHITGSTFSQNVATGADGGGEVRGSAAWSDSTLIAERSTFDRNRVVTYLTTATPGLGATVASAASVAAANVTFSANEAGISSAGAVVTISAPTVDLVDVTAEAEAGGYLFSANALTVRASALHPKVGSTFVSCSSIGTHTSNGDNWSTDASCGLTAPTDVVAAAGDPLLGALAANGGPTATHLPQAGSPLVNVIPSARCALPTDQRGVARPAGAGCDMGAVEVP